MRTARPKRSETATCAYCPEMCRFVCPVSNATCKQTHTPSGKMSLLHLQRTGARGFDEAAGAALFACTGCGRCTASCRHSVDVAAALLEARAEVVDEGEAPKSVDQIRDSFAKARNPFGVDLAARAREISRETEGRAYFPGCTAIAREPSIAKAAIDAAAGFGIRLALGEACADCCGYPLLAAGLRAEFVEHARGFAKRLEGHAELIVGDPGCAVTLLRHYPEAGVELKPKIVLLLDLLADRLEYAFGRAPLNLKLSYHEACKLGRELGRREGPRRLLRAAVGKFHEPAPADAGCAGGGGLLALTMPEAAARIATEQAKAHLVPEHRIVTACPTACRAFRRAGIDALDLFTVLARWIAFRDEEEARF